MQKLTMAPSTTAARIKLRIRYCPSTMIDITYIVAKDLLHAPSPASSIATIMSSYKKPQSSKQSNEKHTVKALIKLWKFMPSEKRAVV